MEYINAISILASLLVSITFLYWYLTKNLNYWKHKGVGGPKPVPLFGNIWDLIFTPQPVQDLLYVNTYGKIFGFYFGNTPVLVISDPDLIKSIMVKDFHLFTDRRRVNNYHPIIQHSLIDISGEDWKRVRTILSPTFTPTKIKKMQPIISECLNQFIDSLQWFANNENNIDVKVMYGNFSIDIITKCALNTKVIDYTRGADNPFVTSIVKAFNLNIWPILSAIVLPKALRKYIRRTLEISDLLAGNMKTIIDLRREDRNQKQYNDFLQIMLDSEANSKFNSEEKILSNDMKQLKYLTEDEVLAQAVIFVLAAYDDTSTLLTYCTYELALNPQVQQRLYEEIESSVATNGESTTDEILVNLPFLDAVVNETLRLHSPALRLSRICSTNYKLGDTGITVEAGTQIDIPIYAIHHLSEYFENPFKFNPDRFMPENKHMIKPYTFMPFGSGPRNCIGYKFGLLAAKMALFQIIRNFRFFRSPHTEVPLKKERKFLMNSTNSLTIGIEKREKQT